MKESKTLEFKSTLSNTFLKTVSAYANFGTGRILFGVDDKGQVIGVEDPKSVALDIENKINDTLVPRPNFSLQVDKDNVIILTVEQGEFTPYLYKGKAYRRSDTATIEVEQRELKRLILAGENLSFEQLPADDQDLRFDDLFLRLKNKIALEQRSQDVLRTLGLMDSEGRYNHAAALVADSNHFPGIDIARFGADINEILYRETLSGISILKQLERSEALFLQYYRKECIRGLVREEEFLIPFAAFRETVANALVHRAWDIPAHIRIAFFDDRIEVYSPGGLPTGLSKEDYLRGAVSQLRNPMLANVFFRLGLIEMFGTGILRIRQAYRDALSKPVFEVSDNSMITTLPTTKIKAQLTADEAQVFQHFSQGLTMTSRDLVEATGFGRDKVLGLLKQLIAKGMLQQLGRGRGTRYQRNGG